MLINLELNAKVFLQDAGMGNISMLTGRKLSVLQKQVFQNVQSHLDASKPMPHSYAKPRTKILISFVGIRSGP